MISAVLIAGTHSGVGKTTITLGLMAALRKRGLKVQPFKVGPDFIDPSHHTTVCGRPSRNLDTYMMGVEGVKRSFAEAVKDADVAVVEGVMGIFDGLDASEEASSAHVAKALNIPVLLVMDVRGTSRSAGAMELGYSSFDPEVKIAGTLLNRVGSERHLSLLKKSLKRPILGAVPVRKEVEVESRHLGLQMSFEKEHNLGALASLVEEHSDVDGILKLGWKPSFDLDQNRKGEIKEGKVRIGVAMDEAFCFYYHDNLEELRKAGAEISFFSPLRDDLPDVDGLYIGGGYPELHQEGLEAGRARKQIRRASEDDMPIYGECGGLMYLTEAITSGDSRHSMVGALPAETIMTKKLQALGYVEAEVVKDNPVSDLGKRIRGHEFHYSRIDCQGDARFVYHLARGKGSRDGLDGLLEHSTLGGYLHTHFYSYQIGRFIDSCRSYSRR